ncbi:hypothetical protein ACFWPA_11630 [Rhodococcus sp. NPDC058505]|uniref:hypothetical protein n=1 Tax=unclassified Rhodococcus (in: high G+C Gram-positive bacteria) TaxID=192944 RepID=UPI00364BBDE5
MGTILIYALFLIAGFAIGGAYSMWRNGNKLGMGVLIVIAALAAAGGVLRLV